MKSFKFLCTMLLAALTFAACSNDEIVPPEPNNPQPAGDGIPFKAIFGVKNGSSRALDDLDDGTLTASWQVDEEIAIVFGGNKYTVKVTSVTDGCATVEGTLPSSTPNNQAVTYIYPASAGDVNGLRSDLLASQDGTLATISSSLDVATAEGSIVIVDGTAQPNGTVALENQFAICKFSFKDDSDQPINDIVEVKITDLSTDDVIIVKPVSAQSAVYVAMLPVSHTMKFNVEADDYSVYTKTSNSHLEAGKFYRATLATTYLSNRRFIPLTIEAIDDGTISFENHAAGSVYYSINGGERVEILAGETGSPELTAGQKVSFYGDNPTYYTNSEYSKFDFSMDCYVYGNVMSLIDSDDYPGLIELTSTYTFYGLFASCVRLKNHPETKLVLPATTLSDFCYYHMFNSCSGLTTAPKLPATTLANSCYHYMFYGCTSLTKAPELPATTLASNCYYNMFYLCTGLTTAPELPATKLAYSCYREMFYNCTSLTKAPELPATTLASYCYFGMFSNCSRLTTAPELPALTLQSYCYTKMFYYCSSLTTAPDVLPATTLTQANNCYDQMFYNCRSLTKAPDLPATTLASKCYSQMFYNCWSLTKAPDLPAKTLVNNCYYQMFYNCRKLNSVKCLATNPFASYIDNWLYGVASYGIFTRSSSLQNGYWNSGPSGIPSYWQIVYY